MAFVAIGINHKTTPIEVREKFCLNDTQQELLLSEFRSNPSVLGAFVLSTCNRVEIYLHTLNDSLSLKDVILLIGQIKKVSQLESHSSHFYFYKERKAVEHLLYVTTGLDSLVLGEKQILGQVKASLERSRMKGILSKQFNLLANLAIRTGKKAQSETEIGLGGSSISWAAIAMAEKILGNLKDKSLLTIGAGKMGDMAAQQIAQKGFKDFYLINRTKANADEVVKKCGGIASSFADIKEILAKVDVCISCADAPHYVLEKDVLEKVMPQRKGRRLLLIDISMPRNIDPSVSGVENVSLYEIDDLKAVVEENMKKRLEAAYEVEKIISSKLSEFYSKLQKLQESEAFKPQESIKIS